MIRVANLDDLNRCIPAARNFFESSGRAGFNPEAFIKAWTLLIGEDAGFILGRFDSDEPREVIGIMCYPDPFTGNNTAQVGFWFVSAEFGGLEGGMLFNSLLLELQRREVSSLFFAAQHNQRMHKVTNFLDRYGFDSVETVYRKDL